jgi:galactokinase
VSARFTTVDRLTTALGGTPDLIARAPGRVNLIGEHTDYNDGFVLPCAIGVETRVAIRARKDGQINLIAADYEGAQDSFSLDTPIVHSPSGWANYVRGMIKVMQDAGHQLTGADIAIAGTVPQGAGLSSSASLEVAVGQAFTALCGFDLDATEIALLAQKAECDFVGTKCGIMDQLVSARGKAGHALLIDCRTLEAQPVPIPETLTIMIVHSGITRGLVDGAYNERRAQCEAVAAHFGVRALRDLDVGMLEGRRAELDPLSYARARHVITENQRTLDAAQALQAHDLKHLGALMAASHASMRDDFDITLPAIDHLVDLIQRAIGDHGGARMTGGGFGGAAVALMPASNVSAVKAAVTAGYKAPNGGPPVIMIETAAMGASHQR